MNDTEWCQHETTGHRILTPTPDGDGRTERLFPCALTDAQVAESLAALRRERMEVVNP